MRCAYRCQEVAAVGLKDEDEFSKNVRCSKKTKFIIDIRVLPATHRQDRSRSLCVDLKAVRGAYDLIMSTEALDPLGVVTLGRATLHLADQLKECPVDDAENLSVFLIVHAEILQLPCGD